MAGFVLSPAATDPRGFPGEVKAGAEEAGLQVDVFQVQETLSAAVLAKMGTTPNPSRGSVALRLSGPPAVNTKSLISGSKRLDLTFDTSFGLD